MSKFTKRRIAGWVLTGLLAAMLMGPSAMSKFIDWEGKSHTFEKLGFTTDLMSKIGIVEVLCAVLFLIPRTGFLGAILLTGYLGGATVTHLRVGEPFAPPVIIGILVWVALGLRRSEIFSLAFAPEGSSADASG